MSKAEELLDSIPETSSMMYTASPDTEPHIIINADRTVTVPDELKHIAVQGDHNIETVTFDCPRYWDEHDLSAMSMRINYQRPDGHREPCPVENLRINDVNSDMIHFDWTISGNVTEVKGNISFMVCAKIANDEGIVDREWHSRLNQDLVIDEGLDCSGDKIIERNPDILESILVRLDSIESAGGGNSNPSQNPNCGFIAQDTAPSNTSVLWIDTSDDSSNSSQNGNGLSAEASALLITILRNGMYTDDQSANITALAEALATTEPDEPVVPDVPVEPDVPEVTLTSISATYGGGGVPVGTAVTDLTGVVVTAWYSDGSTETVTGYTLSGTIVEGDSVITVTYGGKTATFTVVGIADSESETPHKWANGYFAPGGVISPYANYMYCEEYFPVGSGEHYDLFCPNTAWKPDETHICYYDADKNFISRDHTIKAASVESLPGNNGNLVCLKGTEKPENAAFIRVSTHDVSTYKNSLVITQELPTPDLPYGDVTWADGFVGAKGDVSTDESGYKVSSFISVEPGATYQFGNSNTAWSSTWYGIGIYSALHNGFISRATTAKFTVPDNAKYIRLSAQLTDDTCATATLTKIS